jgi:hypothetical protein
LRLAPCTCSELLSWAVGDVEEGSKESFKNVGTLVKAIAGSELSGLTCFWDVRRALSSARLARRPPAAQATMRRVLAAAAAEAGVPHLTRLAAVCLLGRLQVGAAPCVACVWASRLQGAHTALTCGEPVLRKAVAAARLCSACVQSRMVP